MKIKNKLLLVIFTLIIIGGIIFMIINHKNTTMNLSSKITEYIPQEEISDVQMRETMISLYYLNTKTEELKSEGKLINATELIKNPYKTIVELLISGPTNPDLQNIFPKNTKILDAHIDKNCVTLNFSNELTNYKNDVQKYNIINSLLNTLSVLNEVNSIKIVINNKSVESFDEEYSAIY